MAKRAVVLLSSGLDSTVNLYEAREVCEVVLAITFDYGQRAAPRETERAAQIAGRLNIPHKVISLPWFKEFTRTSLIDRAQNVPLSQQISIDDLKVSNQTAKAVWIPNRNGILLNIAAGFAEGLDADWIVPGFNAEEAATFPDNSEAFLKAATRSFAFSTANKIEAICFTTNLDKTEIVRRGRLLKVPFDLMWPCYFSGEGRPLQADQIAKFEICGQCESCQRFQRAMRQG